MSSIGRKRIVPYTAAFWLVISLITGGAISPTYADAGDDKATGTTNYFTFEYRSDWERIDVSDGVVITKDSDPDSPYYSLYWLMEEDEDTSVGTIVTETKNAYCEEYGSDVTLEPQIVSEDLDGRKLAGITARRMGGDGNLEFQTWNLYEIMNGQIFFYRCEYVSGSNIDGVYEDQTTYFEFRQALESMKFTDRDSKISETQTAPSAAADYLAEVQAIRLEDIASISFSLDWEGGSQIQAVDDPETLRNLWDKILALEAGEESQLAAEDAGTGLIITLKNGTSRSLYMEMNILVSGRSRCVINNFGSLHGYLEDLLHAGTDTENYDTESPGTVNNDTEAGNLANADVMITPSAAKSVTFETYTDPDGYFNISIPSGWQVSTFNAADPIFFGLIIVDPEDDCRGICVMRAALGYQTETAKQLLDIYDASGTLSSALMYLPVPTPEGVLRSIVTSANGGGSFDVKENLGSAYGLDIFHAAAETPEGKQVEGIFGCQTTTIDYGFNAVLTLASGVNWIQAPAADFPEWEPVLSRCLASLKFSESFENLRAQSWAQVLGATQYISESWDQVSDSIMSSWENRSGSYDITMQQQSDAILGYDRIVDTETGETYRASLSFLDNFDGDRYQKVPDGSPLYNQALAGYIE